MWPRRFFFCIAHAFPSVLFLQTQGPSFEITGVFLFAAVGGGGRRGENWLRKRLFYRNYDPFALRIWRRRRKTSHEVFWSCVRKGEGEANLSKFGLFPPSCPPEHFAHECMNWWCWVVGQKIRRRRVNKVSTQPFFPHLKLNLNWASIKTHPSNTRLSPLHTDSQTINPTIFPSSFCSNRKSPHPLPFIQSGFNTADTFFFSFVLRETDWCEWISTTPFSAAKSVNVARGFPQKKILCYPKIMHFPWQV